MSTKAIRRLLSEARHAAVDGETIGDAETEVDAIERAAKVLTMGERVGDLNVRASIELLERIAKESGK